MPKQTPMKSHELKVATLSDLRPMPENARSMTDEAMAGLRASLKRFGIVQPIVINKDGTIIGGHQRYRALVAEGETEAPVVVVDLSSQDAVALNLTLNSPVISGDFTEDALAQLAELSMDMDGEFEELGLAALEDLLGEKDGDPDFNPVGKEGQARVDIRKHVTCPKCGTEFSA